MLHRLATAAFAATLTLVAGCSIHKPQGLVGTAELSPQTSAGADIASFPAPRGRVPVAIYSFKDQTGQYKASPGSSFSTAVTQGATAILIKALKDSGWFLPVERENLQDILTERKIARALDQPNGAAAAQPPLRNLTPLTSANLIIEGSIVGYDENVKSGGAGAKYFGISLSQQYRVDQVSVNLRAIDINTGHILESVSTSKTVYSMLLDSGFYRFVTFKRLLEAEVGISATEPAAICVEEAIRSALAHLIVQGVANRLWTVKNEADLESPIFKEYMSSYAQSIAPRPKPETEAAPAPVAAPVAVEAPAIDVPAVVPAAPPAPAIEVVPPVAPPAASAPVLKAPEQPLLSRAAEVQAEMQMACTKSEACRACRANEVKGSKDCNACYTRVKRCKALRAELAKLKPAAN